MDKMKLGIVLFVFSEAVFFTLLILAYLSFRNMSTGTHSASALDVEVTGLFSLALLSSSVTAWRAGRNLEKGNYTRLNLWLLATIVLGGAFLFGQGIEWLHLIHQGTTISRNLFGTTFFTLTGFHGLHVLLGLVMLAILLGLGLRGEFKNRRSETSVEIISIYWHFVDAVWIVIFSVVYLELIR